MAINPTLYPNVYQSGPAPAPPVPGQADPVDPRTRYIRVWTNQGWLYYRADNPKGQEALAAAPPGSKDVEAVPVPGWTGGDPDGKGTLRANDGDWSNKPPSQ